MFSSEDFFKVPVFWFKCLGSNIPPFGKQELKGGITRLFGFLYGYFCFHMVMFAVFTFRYSYYGFKKGDYDEALTAASSLMALISAVLKAITFSLQTRRMTAVKNELEDLFPVEGDQQIYNVDFYQRLTHRFASFYAMITALNLSVWSFAPLMKGIVKYILYRSPYERSFAYYALYFFDMTRNWPLYISTYTMEIIMGYYYGAMYIGTDLIICAVVVQCIMHFEFISRSLEEFEPNENHEINLNFIRPFIKLHGRCLNLSQLVSDTFKACILMNFMLSSVAICFLLYQMSLSGPELFFKCALFLSANLLQLWILCFFGNKLSESSLSVSRACYNQKWYDADIKYKRLLLIMMMRAQKPAVINLPGFKPTSYELFKEIISKSYNFFYVIKTMFN